MGKVVCPGCMAVGREEGVQAPAEACVDPPPQRASYPPPSVAPTPSVPHIDPYLPLG